MTADISREVRAELAAKLEALGWEERPIIEAMQPLRAKLIMIEARRDELIESYGVEVYGNCLACCRLMLVGDKAQSEASGGILCEECAYTYAEIKANHEEIAASGLTSELDPEGIEAFAEVYSGRVSAGLSVDEKPLYVIGED